MADLLLKRARRPEIVRVKLPGELVVLPLDQPGIQGQASRKAQDLEIGPSVLQGLDLGAVPAEMAPAGVIVAVPAEVGRARLFVGAHWAPAAGSEFRWERKSGNGTMRDVRRRTTFRTRTNPPHSDSET